MTGNAGLPPGRPVVLDDRVRVWADASVVLGGAPWGVLRIAPAGRDFVQRLRAAGSEGLVPAAGIERSVVDLLLPRGIVHPRPAGAAAGTGPSGLAGRVEVVVPAYERAHLLDACLASLRSAATDVRIVVVDDASPSAEVESVALRHGATVIRHALNRGPGAARNTGLAATTAEVIAFVDADCMVPPGWLDVLLPHFDDARVGVVAPRVSPHATSDGLLARHELARSALDMGPRAELVMPGAPLGFLPSATLLVRRACLANGSFDETMRVGEDVDLVWRLVDQGWLVRYEPATAVTHEMRLQPLTWARRRYEYGTSAAALDRRHPQRLTPARLSGWNLAVGTLVLARRPSSAAGLAAGTGVLVLATGLLARALRASGVDPVVAPFVVGKGVVADAFAVGHGLRREWWPLGWLALAAAPRSRVARAAAASMLAPILLEWITRRPRVDLPRYTLLRLVEDAAYGSGVLASAVRGRRPGVLLPQVRLPGLRRPSRLSAPGGARRSTGAGPPGRAAGHS